MPEGISLKLVLLHGFTHIAVFTAGNNVLHAHGFAPEMIINRVGEIADFVHNSMQNAASF